MLCQEEPVDLSVKKTSSPYIVKKETPDLTISVAEKIFSNTSLVKSSIYQNGCGLSEKYNCRLCGTGFQKESTRDAHEEGYCSQAARQVELRARLKPFTCADCDAGFTMKDNYLMHRQNYCQRGNNRKRHSPNLEEGPFIKKFECSVCPAKFNIEKNFEAHQAYYHDNGNNALATSPSDSAVRLISPLRNCRDGALITCLLCSDTFSSKEECSKHLSEFHRILTATSDILAVIVKRIDSESSE